MRLTAFTLPAQDLPAVLAEPAHSVPCVLPVVRHGIRIAVNLGGHADTSTVGSHSVTLSFAPSKGGMNRPPPGEATVDSATMVIRTGACVLLVCLSLDPGAGIPVPATSALLAGPESVAPRAAKIAHGVLSNTFLCLLAANFATWTRAFLQKFLSTARSCPSHGTDLRFASALTCAGLDLLLAPPCLHAACVRALFVATLLVVLSLALATDAHAPAPFTTALPQLLDDLRCLLLTHLSHTSHTPHTLSDPVLPATLCRPATDQLPATDGLHLALMTDPLLLSTLVPVLGATLKGTLLRPQVLAGTLLGTTGAGTGATPQLVRFLLFVLLPTPLAPASVR